MSARIHSIKPPETLLDRASAALAEALSDSGLGENWIRVTAATVLAHTAAELLVLEERSGRACTLQEAVAFLCRGAEGKP